MGVFGTDVSPSFRTSLLLQVLGGLALLSGITSGALAIFALAPRSHSNGPPAIRAVRGIAEELSTARVNYVKSLGFAVHSEENRSIDKSTFLKWSLISFGTGVLALTLFAALGGLK